MMILKVKPIAAIALCSVLTSGCVWVEDTQDLASFVSDVQSKPRGTIEPLPTFEAYHSFVYQGASLRDPFVPLVKIVSTLDVEFEATDGIEPDQNRPRSYLEQFSIDDLKMVGTIGKADANEFWSLILDTNGEIHRVSVDDFIGLDFGKVVAVNEQRVDVVEIISNGRGGWMQRPRTLELVEQE